MSPNNPLHSLRTYQLPGNPQSGPPRTAVSPELALASVEELQDVMRGLGLNLQLLQLDGGAMGSRLLSLSLPPLQLNRIQINRRLHSLGPKPRGVLTVSFDLDPRPGEASMRAHGHPLHGDSLFGLDPSQEVHLTLPAHGTLATVFLPLRALRQWGEQLHWPGFDGELEPSTNVIHLDRFRSADLRCYLLWLFALAESDPWRLDQPRTQRLILEDLMPLLLEAFVNSPGPASRGRPPARISLVKEVQQWMHHHPTTPITLTDLCLQAHASRRTLIQGFQDHLGISPMAYLKLIRLHGIRRRLLQAAPETIQIGPLAAEWGFYNAGHFAADYRRHFGERPRETLRRAC